MPQALSRVPILELSRLLFALASWNPAGGDGLVLKTEGRADTQWLFSAPGSYSATLPTSLSSKISKFPSAANGLLSVN